MADYSRYFHPTVWFRGQQYFREGRVRDLRPQSGAGRVYRASVRGSKTYTVQVVFVGDSLNAMGCSCPFALDGNACKHEAAVLLAIDAAEARGDPGFGPRGNRAGKEILPEVVPLFDAPEEEPVRDYRSVRPYFSMPRAFASIRVRKEDLAEARELVASGGVVLDGVNPRTSEYTGRLLGVDGFFRSPNRRDVYLEFTVNHTKVTQYDCSVSRECYRLNHVTGGTKQLCCKHIAALALLADARLRVRPAGSVTDLAGETLLAGFRGALPAAEDSPARLPSVSLRPRLSFADRSVSLGLKAGEKKLYVVRKLRDFFAAERAAAPFALSAKTDLDFGTVTFDEASAPLAAWMASVAETAARPIYTEPAVVTDAGIRLDGALLDAFFDLWEGREADVQGLGMPALALREGEVSGRMRIEPYREGGEFLGVRIQGELPPLWRGASHLYSADDEAFLRLTPERRRRLQPIFNANGGRSGPFSFIIGLDRLRAFYTEVLPALEGAMILEEGEAEEVRAFLPPPAAFTFRLDAEHGDVSCEAEVAYAGETRPLGEPSGLPWADTAAEDRAREAVARWFPVTRPGYACRFLPAGEDALYDLLHTGVDELNRLGTVLASEAFSGLRVRRNWKVRAGVSLESGVLDLELLSDELTPQELREILAACAAKKKYHRLPSGDLVDLSGPEAEDLNALFEAAHVPLKQFVSGKMHLPAYRALYLDRMLEERDSLAADRDRAFKAMVRSFKTVSESDDEAPESLKGVLRPYQEQGFRWLMTLKRHGFGGILADDMGLGKTLQLIAVILRDRLDGVREPSLIVCPSSLMYNWQEECRRWAPEMRTAVIAGTQAERRALIAEAGGFDLVITSYALMTRDFPLWEGRHFHIAALDEAQYIKNQSAAATKAVKTLQADTRFALTGTPVENRLSELWSIFDFLMPGFLYPYETFRRELETPIVRSADAEATERLRRMVGPFVLRRLKTDVLRDLPPKTEEKRTVVLEGEQRALYDARVSRLQALLGRQDDAAFEENRMAVLAELTRLRQVCCDPSLTAEGYAGPSAKREAVRELLESAWDGGHRCLLFSQFTGMLDLLERDLREAGVGYLRLDGETPARERLALVDRFNRGAIPVFLISLRAGGTGLNLTGADVVIHYDPWWNLAVQNQATDRAHRIGQEKPVSVYRLIARDTIEDRIVQLQETKRDLADSILAGDHASLASLTREEILALLG